MNIGQTLISTCLRYPKKIAIIDTAQNIKMTYMQLNERVNRLGNALEAMGIGRGDRIAILLKNCFQYIEISYAAAKIGVIVVPLNFRLNDKEIHFILKDSGSKLFLVSAEYMDVAEKSLNNTDGIKTILINEENNFDNIHKYEELIRNASSAEPRVKINENEFFGIMYTSGTTGLPKGVIHTHRSLLEIATRFIIECKIHDNDNTLIVSPLFHLSGFGTLLPSIIMGTKITIMRTYEPEMFLKTIQDFEITFSLPVPTMINKALDVENLNKFNFTNLRLLMYGGSSISAQALTKAIEVFQCDFLQGYGLTEGTPLLTLSPKDHDYAFKHDNKLLEAAGRSVILGEVKVVNDNGDEVAVGEPGEIIAQTPQIMQGYWNRDEETQKTLKNNWLYTGDVGIRDEHEYIYIVDRKKDMIISGGENIYPAEVEKIIERLPEILETAVIGVPDKEWGEQLKAFVVFKKGKTLTQKEIIEYCKNNLASYKKPSSVEFISELPRNAGGKILKNKLREPYWEKEGRQV
ncbi:o-succinylbenzoate--CoA ligase [Pueribacillus theae]|uniref:O-succinylbenzoate--CoA ligase n=1 Tax=Pueribacillus theae TaxID=2171751 RepID=A0A2U1JLQ1_9BACI|nr:long-chain-fatty-acid--CoA ligase [Pueribacillus theae]PWA05788.1 o-succinylbenzoate--CoA ligase [Pueribacillus theae]